MSIDGWLWTKNTKETQEVKLKRAVNNIWVMLAQKEITKKELREKRGISTATLAKLGKGENLTTDVLLKICETLKCNINEIVETVPEPCDEGYEDTE